MLTIVNHSATPLVVFDILLHADVSIANDDTATITDELYEYLLTIDLSGVDMELVPDTVGGTLPTGGTAGTFLKKASSTDYDATWSAITISDVTGLTAGLSGKEATITAGTTAQYWRGDKSWQTLDTSVIPENTNLYFTDERAQDAIGAMIDTTLVYTDGTPLLSRAALTGDATASAGSNVLTLATVNSDVGSFTNATITVNAKGLITAASSGSAGLSGSGTANRLAYWTGSTALSSDNLYINPTNDSIGIQVDPMAAFHVLSATGSTINDVVTASASLISETLPTAPTGSTTLIAEPTAGSGGSVGYVNGGSGMAIYANGTTYYFRIYPVLYVAATGSYYCSQFYETVSGGDPNDGQWYDISVSWGAVSISGETTNYFVEYSTDGSSFSPMGVYTSTGETFTSLGGSNSTTPWPSYYVNSGGTPPDPATSFDNAVQQYDGSMSYYYASGQTILYEIDQYKDIGGTKYASGTPRQWNGGSGFTDDSSGNYYYVDLYWTLYGTYDGIFLRKSTDGGSSWSYVDVGNTSSYSDYNFSDDGFTSSRWGQTYSPGSLVIDFTPYGIGTAASGNTIYSSAGSVYTASIPADSLRYIVKHTMTGGSGAPWKVLAPASPSYGIQFSGDYYDLGYTGWGYGTTVTPTSYGFSGTAQNREIKFYGYSGSLLIYSATAYTTSVTNSGGNKYLSGSMTYPSGVTSIKITQGINGAAHSRWKVFSGSTTFTDDDTDASWTNSTPVITPNTAIPLAERIDMSLTSATAGLPHLAIVDITGSGTRYQRISFGIAANSATEPTFQAHIQVTSSTGYMQLVSGRIEVASSLGSASPLVILGNTNVFNNTNSSTIHFNVKGQNDSGLINTRSDMDTVFFGQTAGSDPSATVQMQPNRSSDYALFLKGHASMSSTSHLVLTSTSAGSFGGAITVGGHFLATQGSASTPGLSFRSDSDTGMFGATTNELGFATGGTERIRVKVVGSSPAVGIGVTSPTAKLHLAAGTTTASTAPIKLTSGSLNTTPEVGAIEFLTDRLYYTRTTSTTRMFIMAATAAPVSGRVAYSDSSGFYQDTANFTYSVNRLSPTYITLAASTASAGTAPLKYTSGTLMTTPEVGAQEFLTDKYYATITTGAARKEYTLNDAALTSGKIPVITTNGRLTDSAGTGFVYVTSGAFSYVTTIGPALGGTGIANNAASTITISGAYGLTITLTATTSVTLPTSGTLATLAGTEVLTNKDLTSGTNTFPTFNQNTTGSAATLTTPRTIGGVSFDGSANITVSTATAGFTISGGDLALSTNSITMTGSIGATGARVTKGWFTDLEVTNAIVGSITGNAATVTTNANLSGDVTSSGNVTTIAAGSVDIAMLSATGTPSGSTFLRGDNTWAAAGGGSGDVTKVGTPVNNQIGVWTGDGTIEGDPNLLFDGNGIGMGAVSGTGGNVYGNGGVFLYDTVGGGEIDITQSIDIFTADSNTAGNINIYGGSAVSGNNNGSGINLTGGAGQGTGTGGSISLIAGNKGASGDSGIIYLQGGDYGDTGVQIGGSSANAIFDTSLLSASNKTFTFPNTTGNLVVDVATQTLTNKRITTRVGTETSSATSTPTADTVDQWNVTALAVNDTFAAPTGTPTDGQTLLIRIKDNGTARTLGWNAIYRASSDLPLPTSTIANKTIYIGFRYNAAATKWDLLAVGDNY